MAQSVAYAVSGGNINAPITQAMVDATTVLNLWSGNIDNIEGIDIFTELRALDISTNNLTTLPNSLAQMTSLQSLLQQQKMHLTLEIIQHSIAI